MEDAGATRFFAVLALVVLAGFSLRVAYVVTVTRDDDHLYDATYYELQARAIANGNGYTDPFVLLRDPDRHEPAADHPPLTVFALLPAAFVEDRDTSQVAMRLTMVVFGTATIALVGLLARRLATDHPGDRFGDRFGDAVGITAAVLAALDPNLWMNDGLIMSETLSVLLTVAVLAMVYRVLRGGASWRWLLALGAVTGLGMLARAEFALYLPFLVVPAVWIGARGDRRGALRASAIAIGATVLVVTPWVAFNLSRFEDPTLISTNDGLAIAAANCPGTYGGSLLGWGDVFPPCAVARGDLEQSVYNSRNRDKGLRYMVDHVDELPKVVAARIGRAFSLYRVEQGAQFGVLEGRPEWATWLGTAVIWMLMPLSIVGGVVLRRRKVPIWPLVVPIVAVVAVIALLSGGLARYRAVAEPSFVILGAVGIVAIAASLRNGTHRVDGDEVDAELQATPAAR